MKDGEFDRLRIPLDDESDIADPDDADDPELDEFAQRTGVAASPAQLAAGSAILAGLILLGVAALRRRRGSGPGGAPGSD
jgi:uncharacterized protein (TIGR03382 family)